MLNNFDNLFLCAKFVHTYIIIQFVMLQDIVKSFGKSLSVDAHEDEVPLRNSEYDLKIPSQMFLWQADARPSDCDKVTFLNNHPVQNNLISFVVLRLCGI